MGIRWSRHMNSDKFKLSSLKSKYESHVISLGKYQVQYIWCKYCWYSFLYYKCTLKCCYHIICLFCINLCDRYHKITFDISRYNTSIFSVNVIYIIDMHDINIDWLNASHNSWTLCLFVLIKTLYLFLQNHWLKRILLLGKKLVRLDQMLFNCWFNIWIMHFKGLMSVFLNHRLSIKVFVTQNSTYKVSK